MAQDLGEEGTMARQDRMWSLWGFRFKVEVHAEGQSRRPGVEGGPCLDGQQAISAAFPGTGQQEPGPGQLKQAGERSGFTGVPWAEPGRHAHW